jgi:hypothetical protein
MTFFKPPTAPQGTSGDAAPTRSGPLSTKGGLYLDRRPRPQETQAQPARDEVVETPPVGRLFAVKGGYFDSRGFWVTKRHGGVLVQRGAPRSVLALLSDEQKRVLRTAQLRANKDGLR